MSISFLFFLHFLSAKKMPVYGVEIDEIRQRMLYFYCIQSAVKFFFWQSLQTDSDIVENCVIPETSFRMQHTWSESQLSHNLTNGSSVVANSDVVFTTYQANASLQPAYEIQIEDGVAVCNTATFCSFPFLSKRSSTKLRA